MEPDDDGANAVVDMDQLEADLQKSAPRVIRHMNEDHPDTVRAYSIAFGDHPLCVQTKSAILTGLDVDGFVLEVTLPDGTTVPNVHVPYDRRIRNAKELHSIAVDMHTKAYDKLGTWYKVTSGYYTTALRRIGVQTIKSARTRPLESAVVVVAAVALGIGMASIYGRRHYQTRAITKR
jgi:hypothetical protein